MAPRDTSLPIDESVPIPASVKRAAAAADAIHAQAYPDQNAAPPARDPAIPAADNAGQPATPPTPEPQARSEPAPQPQPDPAPAPDPADNADNRSPEQWKHAFLSMKGRFEQSQVTMGQMQEQLQEVGNELVRATALLNSRQRVSQPEQQQPPKKLITAQDVETYGPELLDTVSRAAREAIEPELNSVKNQNRELQQRLARQTAQGVYTTLDTMVPDWRTINRSPRFHQWCALRDVYSGEVRGKLLNQALRAADAPRMAEFFNGFIRDDIATGHRQDPQAQPAPTPPRVAAVPLDTLVNPGKARPASGDSQVPAEKPVYTHKQIADFYTNVRKGAYEGRLADKNSEEAAIFLAQREGRVR